MLLWDKQACVVWCLFALVNSNRFICAVLCELIIICNHTFFFHFHTGESGSLEATGGTSKQPHRERLKWAKTLSYAQKHDKMPRAFDGGKRA